MRTMITAISLVAACFAMPAWSQNSYFLKIDGIDGESAERDHRSWIDVLAWSWGLSAPSSSAGSGRSRGAAEFQDFSWVQGIDTSVVPIFTGVATGKRFRDATLDVSTSFTDGGRITYFKMIFSNVALTSMNITGSGGESVAGTLAYDKVEMQYREMDSRGRPAAWIKGVFDLSGNVAAFSGDPGVVVGLLRSGGTVNLAAAPVGVVPEPQTWALLLAGLAFTGFIARRRRKT